MKSWLEKNARKLEKPRRLLPPCIPSQGGTWADFGCGEGIFTAVLYEQVGPECEIHAIDRSRRSLQILTNNFSESFPHAKLHSHNVDFRQAIDIPMLDGFVMANSLHFVQANQKHALLHHLVQFLKPSGRAIIVEYNSRKGNFAVPHPIDENGFRMLAEEVGLQDVCIAVKTPSSFMGEMYAGVIQEADGIGTIPELTPHG